MSIQGQQVKGRVAGMELWSNTITLVTIFIILVNSLSFSSLVSMRWHAERDIVVVFLCVRLRPYSIFYPNGCTYRQTFLLSSRASSSFFESSAVINFQM